MLKLLKNSKIKLTRAALKSKDSIIRDAIVDVLAAKRSTANASSKVWPAQTFANAKPAKTFSVLSARTLHIRSRIS